jgi:predicted nucleotidyltransferase
MRKSENKILSKIKKSILSFEPEAEVYLYGSRARNDHNENSDWDLLILLPGEITFQIKKELTKLLFDIELSEKQILNSIFFNREIWFNNKLLHASPFYNEVISDFIPL